jgi:diguanylate cyclase (GGDEF)-like protein
VETSKRLTIGVLFGFHTYEGSRPAPFSFPIIRGMQAAARDKNVNLMLACGVARRTGLSVQRPAWPEVNEETDFIPVGPWNTDGLIFTHPLLTDQTVQYARRMVAEGFPLLFIGGDSGQPVIRVDNEGGIRQSIEHLVGHGHRSIAFIAGYEQDLGDSTIRVNAYRSGVKEFGLEADPRLLEYGQHWDVGGYSAIRRMLQSGVKFTAVVCSNDHSAMGVIKALREAGIQIPRDVAVTGFDDVLESLAQIPPLTSVHFPLFETGYRAILLLEKRIVHGAGAVPEFSLVSTRLVPRQSCGCLPEIVKNSIPSDRTFHPPVGRSLLQSKDELAQVLSGALLPKGQIFQAEELLPQCDRLALGFLESLEEGDLLHFQNALVGVLQDVELRSEDDAHIWQSAVTVLRQAAEGFLPEGLESPRGEFVEDLLHQARALISESTDRRYTRLQVSRTDYDEQLGLLTARLISSTDEDQVYNTLREDLPKVGVRTCQVVFFEKQGEDSVAGSLLHPLEKAARVLRFETRKFPPPGLYPEDAPHSLVLLPLFFQEEKLGYAAFDGGNLDPLAMLVRQLASSIKNVQLHAKVLELSLTDGLTGVHNRRFLEILLPKEAERSRRYKRDLSVIMIDIDHFKKYNDAFGHPAGDEALREIALSIERGVRRGLDVVARYGGEEFAVILPETPAEGARAVAEHIRGLVEAHKGFQLPLTVSLGISSFGNDLAATPMLIDRADRALYQAKSQGRNRTVIFEEWMRGAVHASPGEETVEAVQPPAAVKAPPEPTENAQIRDK